MAQGTTRGVPIDIDPLLTNDSDLLVPSQKAIKTYVDTNTSNIASTRVSRSGDTMSGSLILSGDPIMPFGAATKSYVDTLINGIDWKASANAGTTTALPTYTVSGSGQILTGTVTIPVIDGVTLTANQRLLVKNETSTKTPNNGIYVVTQVNPFILTRSSDANTPALLAEATISVSAGDTLSNTQWHCNPAAIPIVIGTTYITFAEIGSGIYSFSPPLVDTGSVISIPSSSSSVDGYLSSTDWTNFNTAYTSRIATFSVTGSSGAATFTSNTLNIPEYTLSGLGGAGLALANTFTNNNTITKNDATNATFSINNSLAGGGLFVSAGTGTSAEIRYGTEGTSIGIKLYGDSTENGVPLEVHDGGGLKAHINSAGVITGSQLKVTGGEPTGFLKANGDIDSKTYVSTSDIQTITGKKTFSPSITASSALAQGTIFTPTLTAAANSDVLVGLDVSPTFTVGGFTGVSQYAARFTGQSIMTTTTATPLILDRQGSFLNSNIQYKNTVTSIFAGLTTGSFAIGTTSGLDVSGQFKVFSGTGNVVIQNGDTSTDDGINRLQVTGYAIATGYKVPSATGFLKADGNVDNTTYATGSGTASGTNTGDETAARIGVLINGSTTATPNDADYVATSDTSLLKKITWTSVKAFLKTYFDTLYSDRVYNITISGTSNIDTSSTGSYNSVSGYGQNGRNVMIQNSATSINITCLSSSTTDFIATYTKLSASGVNVTFVAGTTPSAVTLVTVSGASQITGNPGSTALLTRTGNTYYLLINNI